MAGQPEKLACLRVAPLRLRLETRGPFRTPEYKGAVFRGGFGKFFRELVCTTGKPTCAGCPEASGCRYSLVFETPVIPEKFTVLRKYSHAPHPFVLTPPLDGRTALPAGAELDVELTLIGPGVDYLPYFIGVFEMLGESGRFGGPFRVREAVSALDGRELVYEGESRRWLGPPPLWRPGSAPQPVRRLRLEFLTPLRIRTGGRYNASPDFVAITHALLRRIHLLAAVYGGGDGDAGWLRPLLKQADAVVTERASFALYRWSRTSGRQKRTVPMDGVVGWLEAAGELTELAPYLRAGEWLQVGSGTSLGMGKYRASMSAN